VSERALAQPGQIIADKYVVKDVIGRGGVGVVVAADHRTLKCPVALKFLRPEIAHDPEVVQRFLREARAAARLRSEHVARVMDADSTEDGTGYLVMELLEGRDFAAIVEEGPLPVATAVDYLTQACEAVAEAHSLGIIHRDLKSANLFLTRRPDGTPLVKVLDFGLSKVDRSLSEATLTDDNHVMGSPHFMAPEQMRSSREVDARSDIWSLGVILYTLLAGRVPFEGVYLTEVCAAVLSGSPRALTTLRADVPRELAAVVERCLRLEPQERFQTVAELVAALAPFRGGAAPAVPTEPSVAPLTRPAPTSRRRPTLVALVVSTVVALGATTMLIAARRTPAADVPHASAVELPAAARSAAAVDAPAAIATATASGSTSGAATAAGTAITRPAPPRRTTGFGARRAGVPPAPAAVASTTTATATTPAAQPGKPKSDEDLILTLPH
jgi:serine/threonine-protein kinase